MHTCRDGRKRFTWYQIKLYQPQTGRYHREVKRKPFLYFIYVAFSKSTVTILTKYPIFQHACSIHHHYFVLLLLLDLGTIKLCFIMFDLYCCPSQPRHLTQQKPIVVASYLSVEYLLRLSIDLPSMLVSVLRPHSHRHTTKHQLLVQLRISVRAFSVQVLQIGTRVLCIKSFYFGFFIVVYWISFHFVISSTDTSSKR